VVVSGDAPPAKSDEVRARLEFLLSHLGIDRPINTVRKPTLQMYLRSTALVAADATAVPGLIRRHVRWVADLDYDRNPRDGWVLMDLGMAIRGPRKADAVAARDRFVRQVERLRGEGTRPVYVFGTGPSLHEARNHSFGDGLTIVCNTIVRDADLWHHLRPSFLVAGDAIYHFGRNAHAHAFRVDALRRLIESDGHTLFVYPAQMDVVVRAEFTSVEELLVPIPHGEHTDISVDLTRHFALPLLENVLANQLLPLACTLSRDIRLWGFDGRAPSDEGFWANSQRHAYPELMQSIRDSHPAFFAEKVPRGNETKYVNLVHGDLLDARMADAERRGFEFRMLHRSWTPTLQKRYVGPFADSD
jgi:hypothetical protein